MKIWSSVRRLFSSRPKSTHAPRARATTVKQASAQSGFDRDFQGSPYVRLPQGYAEVFLQRDHPAPQRRYLAPEKVDAVREWRVGVLSAMLIAEAAKK